MQFFKTLKWWQKLIVVYLAIAIPYSCASKDNEGDSGANVSQSENDDIERGGRTKTQWMNFCRRVEDVKKECAVAANIGECVKIRAGAEDAMMAQTYCSNGEPLYNLMGFPD